VDELPKFFNTKKVRAIKTHKCCECGEAIKPGEKYERAKGKWDNEICTFKTCETCARIREDYCPDGSEFGGLRETLWECLGFDYVTGKDGSE
jgi:hypothetical protein